MTGNSLQVSLILISFQGSKWNTTHMVSVRKGSGSKTLIFQAFFSCIHNCDKSFSALLKYMKKKPNVYFHVVKTAMKYSKLDTDVHTIHEASVKGCCTATVLQKALLNFFFHWIQDTCMR